MNLSLWGIRYPLPSVLAFVLLTVAGFWGWHKLPISQLPDIALPTIQVTVGLPGAAPSTLETDVTRKIEDAVSSIPDIDKITSAVSEGTSITKIEFELGRDLDQALDEVRLHVQLLEGVGELVRVIGDGGLAECAWLGVKLNVGAFHDALLDILLAVHAG